MLYFYSTQGDHNYLINLPHYVDLNPEKQGSQFSNSNRFLRHANDSLNLAIRHRFIHS